jgi:hypothetical protein
MLDSSNAASAKRKYKLPGESNLRVWHTNLKDTKAGSIFLSYVRVQTETGPAHAHSNHANTAPALYKDETTHMHRYAGSFLGKVVIKHVRYREN